MSQQSDFLSVNPCLAQILSHLENFEDLLSCMETSKRMANAANDVWRMMPKEKVRLMFSFNGGAQKHIQINIIRMDDRSQLAQNIVITDHYVVSGNKMKFWSIFFLTHNKGAITQSGRNSTISFPVNSMTQGLRMILNHFIDKVDIDHIFFDQERQFRNLPNRRELMECLCEFSEFLETDGLSTYEISDETLELIQSVKAHKTIGCHPAKGDSAEISRLPSSDAKMIIRVPDLSDIDEIKQLLLEWCSGVRDIKEMSVDSWTWGCWILTKMDVEEMVECFSKSLPVHITRKEARHGDMIAYELTRPSDNRTIQLHFEQKQFKGYCNQSGFSIAQLDSI